MESIISTSSFSSQNHRIQFTERLAADLENEKSGDVVFAVVETTDRGETQGGFRVYKYLYAWKHCLLAGGRDSYFGKRSPHQRHFTDKSVQFPLGSCQGVDAKIGETALPGNEQNNGGV